MNRPPSTPATPGRTPVSKPSSKPDTEEKEDDGLLERIAREIDPPGREVSDQDLKDPGRMTPGARPTVNRS